MGESRDDRAGLMVALATQPAHPDSVPINLLVKVPGTPLAEVPALPPFEFVRTLAVARIMMPASMVRLSAGREGMSDELQALCFLAGANSIFYGAPTPNATSPCSPNSASGRCWPRRRARYTPTSRHRLGSRAPSHGAGAVVPPS